MTHNETTDLPEKVKRALRRANIKVEVKQRHIDEAVAGDSHSCMIAEAIKERLPAAKQVIVDLRQVRWTDTKTDLRWFVTTPLQVAAALCAYDQGIKPGPFSFWLREGVVGSARKGPKGNSAQVHPNLNGRAVGRPRAGRPTESPTAGEASGRFHTVAGHVAASRVPVHLPSRFRRFGIRALRMPLSGNLPDLSGIFYKPETPGNVEPA